MRKSHMVLMMGGGRGRDRYNNGAHAPVSEYGEDYADGYYHPDELDRGYSSDAAYRGAKESSRRAGRQSAGRTKDSEHTPLTYDMAMLWASDMENSDGTRGPHWSMEQVEQVMEQHKIKCDPAEFYAVLNSVYSDYCAVAKKFGVNKMDFYADLAKAWLEDDDAVEDKAGKYFAYIVKH